MVSARLVETARWGDQYSVDYLEIDEAQFMDRPASRILIVTDHCESPIP